MSRGGIAQHKCAWPKCGTKVLDSDYIAAVGENTGRIYACRVHRDRMSLAKGVIGVGAVAMFREGMDRAAPGMREKIYETGKGIMGLVDMVKTSMQKDRERDPAE